MNRVCPFCACRLVWRAGEDVPGRERGGNAREQDTFLCVGCLRMFLHVVSERFDGDRHWWSVKQSAQDPSWASLDEAQWPK